MTKSAIFKLNVDSSKPFAEVVFHFNEQQSKAEKLVIEKIGCQAVFWSRHGSIYPAFIDKPTDPQWAKNGFETHWDGNQRYYLATARTKTEAAQALSEARKMMEGVPSLNDYCKEHLGQCVIQVMCEGNSPTSFIMRSTGFGLAKGHLLMNIPFNKLEEIKAITIPEGFEEITETQLAELES